jgi:hypothetical protein
MNAQLIILIVGTALIPLGKLVGLMAEKTWGDAWLLAAGAAFVLAFFMYATFRSRVLTFGGKALKALSAMGSGQRPVN